MHRNITVERSTFNVGDLTVIDAKSVAGFAFNGNTVRRRHGTGHPPYGSPLFRFHGSSDVRMSANLPAKGPEHRHSLGLSSCTGSMPLRPRYDRLDHQAPAY